jgi:hypothetical protein
VLSWVLYRGPSSSVDLFASAIYVCILSLISAGLLKIHADCRSGFYTRRKRSFLGT